MSLSIKMFRLIFALLNSLAFAILSQNLKTPMHAYSQLCNAILDQFLCNYGKRGVAFRPYFKIFGLFYFIQNKDKIINFG